MKNDHPALDSGIEPIKHVSLEESLSKHAAGGHKPHHEHFKAHAAGHKLHHEHVAAMCKGGKA